MMYERQGIQQTSIWKPGHIALLAGSAALIAVVFIRRRGVSRYARKKRRKS
jgi:hypothetical protein